MPLRLIELTEFHREEGYCWIAPLPADIVEGDSVDCERSDLLLFENGSALGPGHSAHAAVRERGQGAYSHWGRAVWFSTSDNSSPLLNSRKYAAVAPDASDGAIAVRAGRHSGRPPVNLQPLDDSEEAIERDASYAISIADSYVLNVPGGRAGVRGRSWLELGPGTNLGTALVLLARGASYVGVADRFLVPFQTSYHDRLYRRIRSSLQSESEPADTRPFDAILNRREHAAPGLFVYNVALENLADVVAHPYDVTASNAVLEHLFNPAKAIYALCQLTFPGGFGVHQVDFRDHRTFDQPLAFLLEDERTFATTFEQANGETGNRVRPYQMEAMFRQAGFGEVDFRCNMEADREYLRDFVPCLRRTVVSPYHAIDETRLVPISGRFVVKK